MRTKKNVINEEIRISKLCEYVVKNYHIVDYWDNVGIAYKELVQRKICLIESAFMAVDKNPISNPSIVFKLIYLPIIKDEIKNVRLDFVNKDKTIGNSPVQIVACLRKGNKNNTNERSPVMDANTSLQLYRSISLGNKWPPKSLKLTDWLKNVWWIILALHN